MKRWTVGLAAGVAMMVAAAMALPSMATNSLVTRSSADHTTLTYLVKPGGARTFALPGSPVRIEVAASFVKPPKQSPISQVMGALVGYEPETHQLSWVGTNSDGTQVASNEGDARTIAKICGTTCSFVLARLKVTTGPDMVTLSLNGHAGSPANFTVNLWY